MVAYGAELPDCEVIVNDHAQEWIALLPTLSSFVATRSKLEKELGKQLAQAASAARLDAVKAARGTTLDELHLKFLECQDLDARCHLEYAEELAKEAAALDQLGKRLEHVRSKHHAHAGKLFAERDKAYEVRNAAKSKYYAACDALEHARQKKASSKDPQRANKAYDAAEQDMLDHKNQYLLDNDTANVAKARLYSTDLPALHDDFQTLEKSTASAIANQLSSVATKSASAATRQQDIVSMLEQGIAAVNVEADQQAFVDKHKPSLRAYEAPPDLDFEPSPVWHDTPEMSITPSSTVYLNNIKLRHHSKLAELTPLVESKQREIAGLRKLWDAYEGDRKLGDPTAILESLFGNVHETTLLEIQSSQAEAQIELIDENLGDAANDALRQHELKSSSFVTPSTCAVCEGSVWGKGLSCKACGAAVHTKCELKMPANCSKGSSAVVKRSTSARSTARARPTSTSSSALSSKPSAASPLSNGATRAATTATMVYDYEAGTEQEASASAGESVDVLEPDDGSGWLKVRTRAGAIGLVPASYAQLSSAAPSAYLTAPRSAALSSEARVLYDYAAQSEQELSVSEGEELTVTDGQTYSADGWTEVARGNERGLVPTSYLDL